MSVSARSYWLANLADVPPVLVAYRRLRRFRHHPEPGKAEIFEAAFGLGIGQFRDHIAWVADLLQEHRPANLVELGTQRGGNAFYLAQFMPPGSHLVTVDLHPRLSHQITIANSRLTELRKRDHGTRARKRWRPFTAGCSLPRARLIRRFSTANCRVIPYYTNLNPFEDAYFIAGKLLGTQQFDAIFYDADKVKESVELHLRAYLPYLRRGGLLVLDDIRRSVDSANNGMRLLWDSLPRELEKHGESPVLDGRTDRGIGVAVKR